MNMNPAIFREYGVRGVVDKYSDEDLVKTCVRAAAKVISRSGGRSVVAGRGCKLQEILSKSDEELSGMLSYVPRVNELNQGAA